MTDKKPEDGSSPLDKLKSVLPGIPWLEMLGAAWKVVWKVVRRWTYSGMYEVLEHESTLELKDRGGGGQPSRNGKRCGTYKIT